MQAAAVAAADDDDNDHDNDDDDDEDDAYLGLVEVVPQHGQLLDGFHERVEHLLVLVEQRLQLLRTSHRAYERQPANLPSPRVTRNPTNRLGIY